MQPENDTRASHLVLSLVKLPCGSSFILSVLPTYYFFSFLFPPIHLCYTFGFLHFRPTFIPLPLDVNPNALSCSSHILPGSFECIPISCYIKQIFLYSEIPVCVPHVLKQEAQFSLFCSQHPIQHKFTHNSKYTLRVQFLRLHDAASLGQVGQLLPILTARVRLGVCLRGSVGLY